MKLSLEHVLGFSIVIVAVLFGVYVWFCARKIYNLNAEIKKVLAASELVDALRNSSLLTPAWTAFNKTLTKETYSTTDAAEFFNQQNLTRGMNMNFWQAYGGIFTGLGILGTFAGLTFGLSGVDMTSVDVEILKKGISNLLSGVSTAFVTSLVGIGAALFYSVIHNALLANFQKNIQSLAEELDKKFPRRSAEDWLADNHSESQNQTAELKNIGGQITTENSWLEKNNIVAQNQTTELQTISTDIKNIGEQVAEAIYDGLDEKLGTYVDEICAAIEKLGTVELGTVISKGVGSQMDRFSAALDRFSDGIDEKLKNANEISKIMNEQLLNTLKDLDKTLKERADADAKERDETFKQFLATLKNLTDTLNEVADKIKINGIEVNNQAKKDRENHEKETQAAFEQFLSTLAGLSKTLQDVAKKIKEQQGVSINTFNTLIENLIRKLEEFTDQQKDFLKTVAASNATQISDAVKNFREIVDAHNKTTQKMFAQVQKQLSETETFLELMNDASTSLKRAAEPVKQSTQQLTNNLIETSAQMKTLATANQITRDNLYILSDNLKEFVNNFKGIADELEKSTTVIKNSLEHYNYEMSEGLSDALTKFDSNMDKSVSHLQTLMENLTDALEDLKKIRGR